MPRGKRKTYSEKLAELQEAIHSLESQLKELKSQERELTKMKKEEELKQIADILEEKNISPEDLVELLSEAENEKQEAC